MIPSIFYEKLKKCQKPKIETTIHLQDIVIHLKLFVINPEPKKLRELGALYCQFGPSHINFQYSSSGRRQFCEVYIKSSQTNTMELTLSLVIWVLSLSQDQRIHLIQRYFRFDFKCGQDHLTCMLKVHVGKYM